MSGIMFHSWEMPSVLNAGAQDCKLMAPQSMPVSFDDLVTRLNEVLTEVSYLRQQNMELTNQLALNSNFSSDETPTRTPALEAEILPTRDCTWPPVPVPPTLFADDGVLHVSRGFDVEDLRVYKSFTHFATGPVETVRAEWKIRNFSSKLRDAMGRPLVSNSFKLWGLDEVHLMVMPMSSAPRSRKEKEQFVKMTNDGPLDASLVLKVPNAQCILEYCLGVGKKKTGPHSCDFSNTTMDKRGSFGINWLEEKEPDSSIIVSVEMLPPPPPGLAPPGL